MNIMLRWARRIAIFLLLGAIVNCAVAWGCAFTPGGIPYGQYLVFADGKQVNGIRALFITSRFGYQYVAECHLQPGMFLGDLGDDLEAFQGHKWWKATSFEPLSLYGIGHLATGWPMLALSARLDPDSAWAWRNNLSIDLSGGIPWDSRELALPAADRVPVVFPVRPLWPGFAVNTLFYAVVIGLLCGGAITMKRIIRRARGQCSFCAYPRGTSPVCTECGEPLPGVAAK